MYIKLLLVLLVFVCYVYFLFMHSSQLAIITTAMSNFTVALTAENLKPIYICGCGLLSVATTHGL